MRVVGWVAPNTQQVSNLLHVACRADDPQRDLNHNLKVRSTMQRMQWNNFRITVYVQQCWQTVALVCSIQKQTVWTCRVSFRREWMTYPPWRNHRCSCAMSINWSLLPSSSPSPCCSSSLCFPRSLHSCLQFATIDTRGNVLANLYQQNFTTTLMFSESQHSDDSRCYLNKLWIFSITFQNSSALYAYAFKFFRVFFFCSAIKAV